MTSTVPHLQQVDEGEEDAGEHGRPQQLVQQHLHHHRLVAARVLREHTAVEHGVPHVACAGTNSALVGHVIQGGGCSILCAANPTVQQQLKCLNTIMHCIVSAAYGGEAGACGRNKVLQRFSKQKKHCNALQDNKLSNKSYSSAQQGHAPTGPSMNMPNSTKRSVRATSKSAPTIVCASTSPSRKPTKLVALFVATGWCSSALL